MKLKSFTLAEMLVVMVIVATLAMLTIPTVVKTNRDRAYANKLDAVYEKIETALILDKIFGLDVGKFGISAINKDMRITDFFAMLNEKLKTIKNCGSNQEGCFGATTMQGYKLRLISGAGILVNDDFYGEYDSVDPNNPIVGSTYIDVDGPIGLNQAGLDQFGFYITPKGLIPMGGPQDVLMKFSDCLNNGSGFACSAWVLVNKNMDYRNCPNVLNWENRTRCE